MKQKKIWMSKGQWQINLRSLFPQFSSSSDSFKIIFPFGIMLFPSPLSPLSLSISSRHLLQHSPPQSSSNYNVFKPHCQRQHPPLPFILFFSSPPPPPYPYLSPPLYWPGRGKRGEWREWGEELIVDLCMIWNLLMCVLQLVQTRKTVLFFS